MPCNVREPGQLEAVFERVAEEWGRLDFLLHSIAFAPKEDLHRRVVDCSQAGFALAMDVSCHSFIRMAKLAEPLMRAGGCLLTLTYLRIREGRRALQPDGAGEGGPGECVRYMAAELAPKGIRVHAISPGPVKTRAASGIDHFDELLERAPRKHHSSLVSIEDVGAVAAFLVGDWATLLTGSTTYVDAGYHIIG